MIGGEKERKKERVEVRERVEAKKRVEVRERVEARERESNRECGEGGIIERWRGRKVGVEKPDLSNVFLKGQIRKIQQIYMSPACRDKWW